MSEIADRIAQVQERIVAAAGAAGRPRESIKLVAVSKSQPAWAVAEAHRLGLTTFGENYAQEVSAKARELSDAPGLRWHFVGHLQTNKVRIVAPVIESIHSVDSTHLAAELGRRLAALGRTIEVLIEVNVAKEPAKTGCSPSELETIIDAVRAQPSLQLRGLMTMPPYNPDPERGRPFFAALRALQTLHGGRAELPELSMGMSDDFEVAIGEGATLVRVGTAIFGERAQRAATPRAPRRRADP